MTTNEVTALVKDLGVPIAMLVWFALRVEKKLDRIFDVLAEYANAVRELIKELAETRADISGVHPALGRADVSGPHRALGTGGGGGSRKDG